MNAERSTKDKPRVVAVCISGGGVPKRPLRMARVSEAGVEGDHHAHAKHNRPDRAISIFDIEIMRNLVDEGFPLEPGTAGENLTVAGLHVQQMRPGTLLEIGDVLLRLEQARKPCFVLDAIDPNYNTAAVDGLLETVLNYFTRYKDVADSIRIVPERKKTNNA